MRTLIEVGYILCGIGLMVGGIGIVGIGILRVIRELKNKKGNE